MDKNTISCEIAKDLIPLYSDGLCGEESRLAVENHLSECESCRRLLEIPIEHGQSEAVPEEKKVFRKLSRKMKRGKLLIIALSIVLTLIVGAVGFLTVGQIVKGEGMVSFETITQSIEARKVVGYIADKDFLAYVNTIHDNNGEVHRMTADSDTYKKILRKNADELAQAYEAAFGEAEVKSIDIDSRYIVPTVSDSVTVQTMCTIYYKDGGVLMLELMKNYDSRFSAEAKMASVKNLAAGYSFCDCFNLINNMNGFYDIATKRVLEGLYSKPGKVDSDWVEIIGSLTADNFSPECKDEVSKSVAEFFGKDYSTKCTFSEDKYDEDLNRYFDMYLTANDEQGSAILTARIYRGYDGFIKPDSVFVYRNGCSDELALSLERFFG